MVGIGGAVALAVAGVAAAVAAGVAAHGAIQAAEANADAQKYTADANAHATIVAAKEAADAQKTSALYDMKARTHESDVMFNTDMEYIKQDKWAAEREDSKQNFYQQTQAQVDSIDMYYSGEGSWGLSSGDSSYDYGYDGGGGGGMTTS